MRNMEKYVDDYLNDDFENTYQILYRRKKVLEIIEHYPHKEVLEIGCGMEPLAKYMTGFKSYTIVEPSEVFAQNARKMLGETVEVVQEFFEESISYLQNKRFDFVLISSLLHELENPEVLIKCLSSVVSSNTVIHINVPNAKSFHRMLAKESGLIEDIYALSQQNVKLQQHKVFDMKSLTDFIQNVLKENEMKIDVLDSGGYFIKPFSHRQMQMCLQNKIIDENILSGFFNMAKYMPELASEIYLNFSICKSCDGYNKDW